MRASNEALMAAVKGWPDRAFTIQSPAERPRGGTTCPDGEFHLLHRDRRSSRFDGHESGGHVPKAFADEGRVKYIHVEVYSVDALMCPYSESGPRSSTTRPHWATSRSTGRARHPARAPRRQVPGQDHLLWVLLSPGDVPGRDRRLSRDHKVAVCRRPHHPCELVARTICPIRHGAVVPFCRRSRPRPGRSTPARPTGDLAGPP